MKMVRFYISILSLAVLTLLFTSCDDDGYDLGKYIICLATVNPLEDNSDSYYLTLDDGTTLWPAAPINGYYKPKKDQRVLVDFTLLSDSLQGYDHFVRINRLQEILTKQVIDLTAENETEVGNDPIRILEYWIGDHYLNIHFGYNSGGEKIHTINLVENKLTEATNQDGSIVLEFRHNKNNDPEKYGVKSFAAFDLRKYQKEGQNSVDFLIKVKDFNEEEKEYKITYKYGINEERLSTNKTITNMPEDIKYH